MTSCETAVNASFCVLDNCLWCDLSQKCLDYTCNHLDSLSLVLIGLGFCILTLMIILISYYMVYYSKRNDSVMQVSTAKEEETLDNEVENTEVENIEDTKLLINVAMTIT